MKNLLDLVSYAGALYPTPGSGPLPVLSAKGKKKVSDTAVSRMWRRASAANGLKAARNSAGKSDRVAR